MKVECFSSLSLTSLSLLLFSLRPLFIVSLNGECLNKPMELNLECQYTGASQSSSVGVIHVSTSSACRLQTLLSGNCEVAYSSKRNERN